MGQNKKDRRESSLVRASFQERTKEMADKETVSVLEQLEQEFETIKEQHGRKDLRGKIKSAVYRIRERSRSFRKWQYAVAVCGVILLISTIVAVLRTSKTPEKDMKDNIPAFLTAEEKKDWEEKEVDYNEIYIYVNTQLEVVDDKVELRLANPPYCAYPLKITITDGETTYFKSEALEPGDSLEETELSDLPKKAGTYDVVIWYEFFSKDSGSVVGEHSVNAEMIINEENN